MYFVTFLLIFICFVYFPEAHWVIISTTQHQISAKSTCVEKNEKGLFFLLYVFFYFVFVLCTSLKLKHRVGAHNTKSVNMCKHAHEK